MAYKVRKFSQIREFEDWMESNGHTIDNATTMVYGCHIVITYKLNAEEMAKAIEGRAKVVVQPVAALPKRVIPPPAVETPIAAPAVIAPAGRAVIQARASVSKG